MSRQSSIHSSRDGDEDLHLTDDEIEDLDAQLAGLDLSANLAMSLTVCDKDDEDGDSRSDDTQEKNEDDDLFVGEESGDDPLAAPPHVDKQNSEEREVTEETSNDDDPSPEDQRSAHSLFRRIFKERLDRDEVFSRHYTATNEEAQEVSNLAKGFGVYGSQHALFDFHSILCMRGNVEIGGEAREVFLLTHGYVMARVSDYSSFAGIVSSLVQSSMVCCEPYSEVEYIRDQPMSKTPSFILKTTSEEYRFICPTAEDKSAWLYAWERVLVADRSLTPDPDRSAGWQHELVQTSLWSAAVTGSAATLGIITEGDATVDLNELDRYNELGVLHYAVLFNQMHILQHVLEDGRAFADLSDGEGRTPMYYAQREDNKEAIQLLQEVGHAQPSKLWEQESQGVLAQQVVKLEEKRARKKKEQKERQQSNRSILFRGLGGSQESPRHRKRLFKAFGRQSSSSSEQDQQQQQAQTAKTQMAENMQLVAERGEKIEDLQEKTNKLQEGISEYASLAKQLKEQSKRKKWYQL